VRVRSLLTVSVALALPTLAAAQHTKAEPARIATIAPPPPIVTVAPRPLNRHGYYYGGVYYGAARYGPVPLLLLTDGRAFADFGYGYEQVVEACGSHMGYSAQVVSPSGTNQPAVIQPTVSQPSPGAPSITPAVPAQTIGHPCWSLQADGRLIAYP
jgi:hypothetical protein